MLSLTDLPLASALSDDALLQRYISGGNADDLTELITRYAPMVYAAARRQVRDADLAEDVMQNVFITFARRVREIRSGAAIGTWLLKATRFTAINAMKIQARRRRHEQAAATERPELVCDADPVLQAQDRWESIEPQLDRAISRLRVADQNALVLRFFRGLSLREIADATGATEEAARKRISRAVARLRKDLVRGGVEPAGCADAGLGALLASRATESVPSHLLAHTITAANSAANLGGSSFLYGAVSMTVKAKILACLSLAALIVGGGYGVIKLAGVGKSNNSAPSLPATAAEASQPAAPGDDVTAAFKAVYELAPEQYCKYIPVPFIPQRGPFIAEMISHYGVAGTLQKKVPDPDSVIFEERPSGAFAPRNSFNLFGNGTGLPGTWAHSLAIEFTDRATWQIQFDADMPATRLPGDWVIRAGATTDQIFQGVVEALSTKLGRKYAVTHDRVPHDVLVASGTLIARPGGDGQFYQDIHMLSPLVGAGRDTGGGAPLSEILNYVSDLTGLWIVNEAWGRPDSPDHRFIVYKWDAKHAREDGKPRAKQLDELMASVSQQTGLTFKHEFRTVDVWTFAPVPRK
jgi:RNA polymerase sigma factor (sigma-70 family)